MKSPETKDEMAKIIDQLGAPNQGLTYHSGRGGEIRYNSRTGEQYITETRPAELTLYGSRAEVVHAIIDNATKIAAMLRGQ